MQRSLLLIWWRTFQLEDWRTFQLVSTNNGESVAFSDLFYVDQSGKKSVVKTTGKSKPDTYNVTRKFPWKPGMKQRSEELLGTVVLASNDPSFAPCDTVARISKLLQPYFQDVLLDMSRGPYTYYRIQSPKQFPHLHLAEIQFLTNRSYRYENTCEPHPLPVFQPSDTLKVASKELRLLDDPLDKVRWKTEYDNNPQTAPSAYPTVNFRLKEPQQITKVRLMPIHADNGIAPGDSYQLLHWNGRKWEKQEELVAQYNYLPCKVIRGELYWLQNLSKGKEELPFIINKANEQQFIYFDIMND